MTQLPPHSEEAAAAPGRASWAARLSLLFAASRLIIFLWLAGRGTDLGVHADYAARMAAGVVPFRHFVPEYPPLALVFTGLPALLDPSLRGYFPIFRAICCTVDCAIWVTLLRLNRARPFNNLLYILGTTALGSLLYDRIDLLLGGLLLLAVLMLLAGRDHQFHLTLGAAIAFKLIPVVWVPAVLGFEWAKPARERHVGRALLLLGLPTILSFLAVALLGGYRFDRLFAYHLDRPIQIESTPASAEMVLMAFGVKGTSSFEYGSVNLHTDYAPALVAQANIALAVVVLGSGAVAATGRFDRKSLALLLAAVLAASLFLSKVLSPQFFLFLLPVLVILPLSAGSGSRIRPTLIVVLYALTGTIFPWAYNGLTELHPAWCAVLLVRNTCLGLLAGSLLRSALLCRGDSQGPRI
jgi:hypothetical protein